MTPRELDDYRSLVSEYLRSGFSFERSHKLAGEDIVIDHRGL